MDLSPNDINESTLDMLNFIDNKFKLSKKCKDKPIILEKI